MCNSIDGINCGSGLVLKCYCKSHFDAALSRKKSEDRKTLEVRLLGSPLFIPTTEPSTSKRSVSVYTYDVLYRVVNK